MSYLQDCYHRPNPPFELRQAIQSYAHAALDVSDGLVADAGHLASVSQVNLRIDLDAIPISKAAQEWLASQDRELDSKIALATGGDDYQVLMCIPVKHVEPMQRISNKLGYNFSRIGEVCSGDGVDVIDPNGIKLEINKPGYTHF